MQQLEQTMRDEGALQARGLQTHLDPNLALTPDQARCRRRSRSACRAVHGLPDRRLKTRASQDMLTCICICICRAGRP